jgi:DNA-binding response OmpR family regulator
MLRLSHAMHGALRALPVEALVASEPDGDLSAFGIEPSRLVVAHVVLIPSERQLFIDGARVHLSAREFHVLHVLALCAGHVVSRERIYENVWGRAMPHPRDRAVDVHIRRLRLRLAQASTGWRYIHTHFGHGYRFEPERQPGRS